jgi:ABC-2 type transport system ATP-binding protein
MDRGDATLEGTAVRCDGLTKHYGATAAIQDVTLDVEPGQVFGFLGPNGSGKTTTMRILVGLVRPTSGRAWLAGRPIPDPEGLSRVGTMIEEPAFHPWLTGRATLEVLALCGPPLPRRDSVGAALERVGLADVADRKVRGYSQGMRQRLGLAVALMREPDLLLLDEPTNGLDPAGIRDFRTLFRSLADEGRTVFLSSHLLAEVERICDRVAVVNKGRIVEQGAIGDVVTAHSRVRVAVSDADRSHAMELLARRWTVTSDGTGALFVDAGDAGAVNRALAAGDVWASELGVERPDLESAYLNLTSDEVEDAPAHS